MYYTSYNKHILSYFVNTEVICMQEYALLSNPAIKFTIGFSENFLSAWRMSSILI